MSKNLVIVESPAKAKTISQYLGKDYIVRASYGHVRDLPASKIGVDIDHDFEPVYEVPAKAKKVINELKTLLKNADKLILATDLDREGEAIAWHLIEALKPKQPLERIVFHEISKSAITDALKHARQIDQDLVDAQQARRVLDRLVGYKLSPFLWQKVYRGLSAGRVQSVAVRLIVEREDEIDAFKPVHYWNLKAVFETAKKATYEGMLSAIDNKTFDKLTDEKIAQTAYKEIQKAPYKIASLEEDERLRNPSAPFITSTLQQEASRKLHYGVKQTMKLAQDLYEGLDLGAKGTAGLITYMRTDSVNLSDNAIKQAREFIKKEYGDKYIPEKARQFASSNKRAQEAHEAIRPVDLAIQPDELKGKIEDRHWKLYDLIWKRTIASQMSSAKVLVTTLKTDSIATSKIYTFTTKGLQIAFDGFLKAYEEGTDDVIEDFQIIPEVDKGDKVDFKSADLEAKQTQPPARYSEAMLVKELEKKGIGRPSTYAPTISTIQERNYVEKLENRLKPTEVGKIVTNLLKENFKDVMDYDFTAKMEDELDDVADGKIKWQKVIDEMYTPFAKLLSEKNKSVEKVNSDIKMKEKCPECGKHLVEKLGRYGRFAACSDYPTCKYTKPLLEKNVDKETLAAVEKLEGKKCPECKKGELVPKEGRFGAFLACSRYPDCKFTEAIAVKASVKCPNDGGDLVRKPTRKGRIFWGCANYPKCKTAFWGEPLAEKCPECSNILIKENDKVKCSQCDYKKEEDGEVETTS